MISELSEYTKIAQIPLTQVVSQEFEIILKEQSCTLAVYQKDENVFVDLTVDGTVIFAGMKALDRQGLKISDYMAFNGQLWFEDLNGTENPNFSEFGTRFIMYYGTR